MLLTFTILLFTYFNMQLDNSYTRYTRDCASENSMEMFYLLSYLIEYKSKACYKSSISNSLTDQFYQIYFVTMTYKLSLQCRQYSFTCHVRHSITVNKENYEEV